MNARNLRISVLGTVVVALALAAVLFSALGSQGPAAAAPMLAPTPVSVSASQGPAAVVTFFDRRVLTTAVGSAAQAVLEHDKVDVQWTIDQGTTPNTTTLKLQFSNDGANWVDGAIFVTNNAADVTDMQQYAVFGRYARVLPTVGNTQRVTVTVVGVAK